MIEKIKKLWARIPAAVRTESRHDAEVFTVAFVGTAKELAPSLIGTPSMSAGRALVLACLLAGGKAAIPAIRASTRKVAGRWLSKTPVA